MHPRSFEEVVLPHLDAAFNYARWLIKNDAEAEDVVQDACVRAVRFFPSLRDDDARAWLFAIVRNTWYSRVSRRAGKAEALQLDMRTDEPADGALDPEARMLLQDAAEELAGLVADLMGRLKLKEEKFLLVKSGGMAGRSAYFDKLLDERLESMAPKAQFGELQVTAAQAAARLALRMMQAAGEGK